MSLTIFYPYKRRKTHAIAESIIPTEPKVRNCEIEFVSSYSFREIVTIFKYLKRFIYINFYVKQLNMERKKYFTVPADYIIFEDANNENSFYCINEENKRIEEKVLQKYNFEHSDVPSNFTIDAIRIENIGKRNDTTDNYEIASNQIVKFPVNRIKYVLLKIS